MSNKLHRYISSVWRKQTRCRSDIYMLSIQTMEMADRQTHSIYVYLMYLSRCCCCCCCCFAAFYIGSPTRSNDILSTLHSIYIVMENNDKLTWRIVTEKVEYVFLPKVRHERTCSSEFRYVVKRLTSSGPERLCALITGISQEKTGKYMYLSHEKRFVLFPNVTHTYVQLPQIKV